MILGVTITDICVVVWCCLVCSLIYFILYSGLIDFSVFKFGGNAVFRSVSDVNSVRFAFFVRILHDVASTYILVGIDAHFFGFDAIFWNF